MKVSALFLLLVPLATCCTVETTDTIGPSTDNPTTTMNETDPEWISLFDGATFDHWRGYAQDAMPAGWIIEDGAMFASTPGAGMDIVTKAAYTDFELELDWRVAEAGNSGIMWHVDESAGGYPWMTGPEYQILDDAAHNNGEIGKNSAGANYDVQAPSAAVTNPAMEWNNARILVRGSHVEHWLNGTKVVEYEKGSADHKQRVAASKWKDMESYGSTSTGHIAFQGDHGKVWFRNLRIRAL
ncbi:MAG: DUF1080 domain-containing protein [Planctomycetota bacterium]|nr:DUF1080 domain-containing protein [Planctomycetota bacterium]MDG2142428.1 DUF1080 domain-containing protein [Planctomycetota bacterium]